MNQRLLVIDGKPVTLGGKLVTVPPGGAEDCVCCDEPSDHDCHPCHDCCFSDQSTVTVNLTASGAGPGCPCENNDVSDVMCEFEHASSGVVQWGARNLHECDPEFPDLWYIKHVFARYYCDTGEWEITVVWEDRWEEDEPGPFLLGSWGAGPGDCCGGTFENEDVFTDICPDHDTTSSVVVNNNDCCRDAQTDQCVHGEPDCDTGECEEEGI